jgi:hypothetical protein
MVLIMLASGLGWVAVGLVAVGVKLALEALRYQ